MSLSQRVGNVQRTVMNLARRRKFHRRTSPGAPPGTLVSDKTKQHTHFRMMLYGDGTFVEQPLDSVAQIPQPGPNQVLWLDVAGLADADVIEAIGQRFGLHPLALEDVLHIHQRAKTEEYNDHLFIVARMLYENQPLESEQVSLFLGSNFVVTFQEDPGDCFDSLRVRIRQKARIQSRGADYLAYGILDAIIDAYFPRLEKIGSQLDEIDEAMTTDQGRAYLGRLHDIRRELILLKKLLWQHRDSLSSMLRLENELISPETHIYLRDCLDHVVQLMDVSETDRESCLGLQELYLAELSQRTNDIMRLLTLLSTFFMPMTLIAGIYGMNFNPEASPWNMPELNWYYGYPFSLALMAAVGGVLMALFWTRGWFQR
ncbi:magnesium/cobalt transporter CorA [Planctomicrobium sp. SH661]|uniref:magnesium/cobalt transporter CorA n=1 Tax=Planctomicrobium sp. SH661 TaxID=3448124 RepID=UPI003F5BB2E0